MLERLVSGWVLLGAIVLAGVVTWPGWYSADNVWPSLSSNLFASVVTTGLTIFGIDVLLRRIERRQSRGRDTASRRELDNAVDWMLNRFHVEGPSIVKTFAPERDDFPRVFEAWVAQHEKDLREQFLAAPDSEVVAVLNALRERADHVSQLIGIAGNSLPDIAAGQLVEAVGIIQSAAGYRNSAQATTAPFAAKILVPSALIALARAHADLGAEHK